MQFYFENNKFLKLKMNVNQNSQQKLDTPLDNLLNEGKISQLTYQKVVCAKRFIERKYNMIKLKRVENNILQEKLKLSGLPENKKLEILAEIQEQESKNLKQKLEKMSASNYESLAIIGRGAFGEVHVCRNKKTGEIVAIKKIKKDFLISKNQIRHTLDEQDFLSKVNSPWIVELKASFQEGDYLYLVMEFCPGGDLMGLFIARDILKEEDARFYICEMILAIDSIHELNCIHRDIKPDNVLIGKDGHIKLTDFGLAKISDTAFKEDIIDYKFDEKKVRHNRNFSCVGTVYYVAPEVIKKEGYGQEVDWWSLGVILFEMLAGYAPFCSKKTNEVCHKVINFEKYLKFPTNCKASKECRDLIYKLVCNPDSRLGKNGSSEIKAHPFFKGINWLKIKEMKPPFIPQLSNDFDCRYFDKFTYLEPFIPIKEKTVRKRNEPEYTGYTFKGKENDPTDILFIINLIQKKKIEVEKEEEKEKKKQNISELKSFSNVETSESKTIQDSSNHNNININNQNKANEIKIIPIKVNPNCKFNTKKNGNNDEINKIKKNSVINPNNFKKSKTFMSIIPKPKMASNSTEHQGKKPTNKIIKVDNSIPIKKKSSILQNVGHSFKSGFKKVFSSSRSKDHNKDAKKK